MKSYLSYGLSILLLPAILAGCKKTEFIPPAEGEKIPYTAPDLKSLGETLKASPYQLFLKAWQRSNMDSVLTIMSLHTLLAPTDAVMQAAGYTDTKIASMTRNEADSLVAYYTLTGAYSKEALQGSAGNRECYSMLRIKAYTYRHYLIVAGDNLLVNGEPAGVAKNALPATNGYIYPIDRLLPKPISKSVWQVLQDDPRFSIFMEVQVKADKLFNDQYRQLCIDQFGFDPGDFWQDSKRTDYKNMFYIDASVDVPGGSAMMFAPTNEAFHQAGFQTVDDVMAWNRKYATPPTVDWDIYDILPYGFPSDTLFAFHWDFGHDALPYNGITGKHGDQKPTNFFVNDLRDEYLANYPVNDAVNIWLYLMPYSFGRTLDGKPTVKVKGSDAEPATVTETIHTTMGPIHVVNRLLIPRNLKMK